MFFLLYVNFFKYACECVSVCVWMCNTTSYGITNQLYVFDQITKRIMQQSIRKIHKFSLSLKYKYTHANYCCYGCRCNKIFLVFIKRASHCGFPIGHFKSAIRFFVSGNLNIYCNFSNYLRILLVFLFLSGFENSIFPLDWEYTHKYCGESSWFPMGFSISQGIATMANISLTIVISYVLY